MRSRRRAVRKQRVAALMALIVMVVAIAGCMIFGATKAQAAPAETSYKYYTSIQVQKGDTLWDIACNYMTDEYENVNEYIAEICEINHLAESDIHSGQYLTIPYYSSEYLD